MHIMCVHPCLVFPSPQLGLTKRFGRPRAVILMAAKPVEPVESVTRSEVESLRHDRIKSNAETYIILRLIYAKVLKEEVSQLQAILAVCNYNLDLLLDSP